MPSLRAAPTPVLAALLAACVLLLGFATVSPALHDELCDHATLSVAPTDGDHGHADAPAPRDVDHGCAVALFASGCTHTSPPAFVSPPSPLSAARVAAFTELLLARTQRGPERVCGPPILA